MFSVARILATIILTSFVSAAPAPYYRVSFDTRASLDNGTLLANGETAQQLNAQFSNLTTSDSCTTGQSACINSAQATCIDGHWKTTKCGNSKSCFALPFVNQTGTFLDCTSQRSALSRIEATGAKGGIFGNETVSNDDNDSGDDGDCSDAGDSSTVRSITKTASIASSPTSAANGNDPSISTVTVTITAPDAGITSTEVSQTTVVAESDLSSVLASITASIAANGGDFSVSTAVNGAGPATASTSGSESAPTANNGSNGDQTPPVSAGTVIHLTAASAAATTSSARAGSQASPSVGGKNGVDTILLTTVGAAPTTDASVTSSAVAAVHAAPTVSFVSAH